MEIVVSGVRPTGNQHFGNYMGAIRNFVKFQDEFDIPCYFFVADYHSLTTHPKPEDLQNNVRQILIEYLACGLDPKKSNIYIQSHVPEIPELYLIFNMLAYKGELERSVTFKDKVRSQPENINAGLLTYPVLMAVDIIVHKATQVPVGKDQEQHLEMTRTFARRFNNAYKVEYFPEPQPVSLGDKLVKVPGLDGKGKMSKSESENSAIFLVDDEKKLRKKVMRAVTDAGPKEKNQAMPEEIQNLFQLLELVADGETIQQFKSAYADCTIRYGDLKGAIAENMEKTIKPIRERIHELEADDKLLKEIMHEGATSARKSASATLKDVKEIIGLR
ncbi:MAG: tryptophan--tRNA ligase [Chitinophagales bacterium]|nr:tryptophan--tRNA ligase [Chitinophagales bacterium]